MATAQDLPVNGMAAAGIEQQEEFGEEGLEGQEVEEKPAIDFVYIDENKLKYLNNQFEKVHAHMYDHKSDVRITVGSQVFKGHRKVLADASDYFDAMFTHKMKEKDEYNIELKEISPEGFGPMLEYFYHGHVTVEHKNVADICEAARFFHVEWILDVCSDFMIRHLSILDFPLVMHLSDKFSLGDLRWQIFKWFGQNLPVLLEKHGFYHDLCEELLMQFLMEGTYTELSEYNLLEILLNWVGAEGENRKGQLVPLLHQIRFHTMDLEELEALPPNVMEDKEIKAEIEDAKCYSLDIACQCLKSADKYTARGARPSIMISTFNDVEESNTVIYKDPYDEESNMFIEQLGNSGFGVQYSYANQGQIGNYLFACGGYELEYASSARVFRYDAKHREWTEMASMMKPRASFGMCNSKNRLYVVGGVNHILGTDSAEEFLKSVEMYNPECNEWKALPDLPHAVWDCAVAHVNNTLYVSGGISGDSDHPLPLNFLYSLADGASEWKTLPKMAEGRQGHSITPYNNKLYVLNGYTRPSDSTSPGFTDCETNEVYDIETKQWSMLKPKPENCDHMFRHVGILDGMIYFLSNRETDTYLGHYDIEKNEFSDPLILVGMGQHKLAILPVAYPFTS